MFFHTIHENHYEIFLYFIISSNARTDKHRSVLGRCDSAKLLNLTEFFVGHVFGIPSHLNRGTYLIPLASFHSTRRIFLNKKIKFEKPLYDADTNNELMNRRKL